MSRVLKGLLLHRLPGKLSSVSGLWLRTHRLAGWAVVFVCCVEPYRDWILLV